MSRLDVDVLTQVPCSVLVASTPTHATSFLLPLFLKAYLLSGVNVLLVTVNNDVEHFCKIGKRMGITLQSYMDNHSLHILDLLSMQETVSVDDIHPAFSFDRLFKMLVNEMRMKWQQGTSGLVLMIESLSSLISLNDRQELSWSFCRYCVAFGRSMDRQPYGFVTVIDTEIDREAARHIQSLFDFVIKPIPIDLISFANVDGKIKLKRNRLLSHESQPEKTPADKSAKVSVEGSVDVCFSTELFFRVRDSGVVMFPDVDLHF